MGCVGTISDPKKLHIMQAKIGSSFKLEFHQKNLSQNLFYICCREKKSAKHVFFNVLKIRPVQPSTNTFSSLVQAFEPPFNTTST